MLPWISSYGRALATIAFPHCRLELLSQAKHPPGYNIVTDDLYLTANVHIV